MRWPGQPAPLTRTGQWGQSAPTTAGAQAGCAPGRQAWLQDPRALIFVVFGVLWLVSPHWGSWLGEGKARRVVGREWGWG